jgi:hypothetical protein
MMIGPGNSDPRHLFDQTGEAASFLHVFKLNKIFLFQDFKDEISQQSWYSQITNIL